MKGKTALAAVAAASILAFSSCTVTQGAYQRKADETDALAKQHSALQKEHEGLRAELAETARQRDKLSADLAYVEGLRDKVSRDRDAAERERDGAVRDRDGALRELDAERKRVSGLEKENARLARPKEEPPPKDSRTYVELMERMGAEIGLGQVAVSERAGRLSVSVADSILFDPGKAEVKTGGEEILEKLASILKGVEDRSIRVEGHTDNARIPPSAAKRYPTNRELSSARAVGVARFLERRGVAPDRLSAVAWGEWKPVADNATPEGRARNRRIEIHLVDRERP